jgi:hypothetical protein
MMLALRIRQEGEQIRRRRRGTELSEPAGAHEGGGE